MKNQPLTTLKKILLIDNYDSFTYNLYDYFLQIGTQCRVVLNDAAPLSTFKKMAFDGLVFSPGPKKPSDAGLMMDLLDYFHDKKNILGVCLGHQAIGEYFGAQLCKSPVPKHGKTSAIIHDHVGLFQGVPSNINVMRYHSLLLQKESLAATPLIITAQTPQGEIMAIRHKTLPICGIQFHPESVLTEFGLEMLKNWVKTL